MCKQHKISKNPLFFIGAVMLVNAYSFSTLEHHIEKRVAADHTVSTVSHRGLRDAGVLPQMLVKRGMDLLQ
jgi:hypothetical protein